MVQILTSMPRAARAAMSSAWKAATDFAVSRRVRVEPSDTERRSTWPMKSNSTSKIRPLQGIAEVVRPRALT